MSLSIINDKFHAFKTVNIPTIVEDIKKYPDIPQMDNIENIFYIPAKKLIYNELKVTGWGIKNNLFGKRVPVKIVKGEYFPQENSSLYQFFTKEIYCHVKEVANGYYDQIKYLSKVSISIFFYMCLLEDTENDAMKEFKYHMKCVSKITTDISSARFSYHQDVDFVCSYISENGIRSPLQMVDYLFKSYNKMKISTLIEEWNNNMKSLLESKKVLTITELSNIVHLLFHLPPYNGYYIVFNHPFARLYTRIILVFEFFYSILSGSLGLNVNSKILRECLEYIYAVIPLLTEELIKLFPRLNVLSTKRFLSNYISDTLFTYLYHLMQPLFMKYFGILFIYLLFYNIEKRDKTLYQYLHNLVSTKYIYNADMIFPLMNDNKFPNKNVTNLLKQALNEPIPYNKINDFGELFKILHNISSNDNLEKFSSLLINHLLLLDESYLTNLVSTMEYLCYACYNRKDMSSSQISDLELIIALYQLTIETIEKLIPV